MNALELADKLEQKALTADAMEYGFEVDFEEAATMLRQQQAEIEALKNPIMQAIALAFDPVKELTDDEINNLWAESHEDGIAMQQGFTTQQHYFANLILRKEQEK